MKRWQAWIPNWLSISRLALTPFLLIPAFDDNRVAFLALGLLLVLTDVLDGALARAWQVTSYRGQLLDSVADTLFHVTFYGLALFLMWTEVRPYLFWMFLPVLWFVLDLPVGWWLTGRPRAMHLWGKKTLSHGYLVWLVWSLLSELQVPGIYLLNAWAFAGFVEEVGIYLIMRETVDESVTSIFQLGRGRKTVPLQPGRLFAHKGTCRRED